MDIVFADNAEHIPHFLFDALKCAKFFNPTSRVIHVGYAHDGIDPFIDAHRFKPLCDDIFRFLDLPPDGGWFHRGNIDRYIWMAELVKEGLLTIPLITCDWDVLLTRDITEVLPLWSEYDYTLAEQMSGGEMLVFNSDVLNDLVQFLGDTFHEDKHPLVRRTCNGSDMYLLCEFRDSHPQFNVGETNEVRGGSIFDSNVRLHRESYEFDGEHKKLYFGGRKVHIRRLSDGQMIRMNNLHCWLEKDNIASWCQQAMED